MYVLLFIIEIMSMNLVSLFYCGGFYIFFYGSNIVLSIDFLWFINFIYSLFLLIVVDICEKYSFGNCLFLFSDYCLINLVLLFDFIKL